MAHRSTIIRILVVAVAVAALSAPAAWADREQSLIVPNQSTEHGSSVQPLSVPNQSTEHSSSVQPLIVPVDRSTEHGGTVAVAPSAPAVIVRAGGFDWTSAGIGAISTVGLALVALGAVAMRGRRTQPA